MIATRCSNKDNEICLRENRATPRGVSMGRNGRREEIIRLGNLITQLRAKLAEVEKDFDLLVYGKSSKKHTEDVEELLNVMSRRAGETDFDRGSSKTTRKTKYPEGPPLNRKVLAFIKQAKGPCSSQDVAEKVDAHHQSIQNSLRDLARRGLVAKLGVNQWIATDDVGTKEDA